ncbi:MAG: PEGA domain-containing protein [Planctomycetes bacterium]|nr:PEGA domain-containing protein [Planctomycetota bacterium]
MNILRYVIFSSILICLSLPLGTLLAASHNPSNATEDPPLKILFIGSSYFNYNDMPEMFGIIAENKNQTVVVVDNTPSGTSLSYHAQAEDTKYAIEQEKWDYVVLQGSGGPVAYPNYYNQAQVLPALETLRDIILANHDATKIIFCMPWAFEDGMLWMGWTDTYSDMQQIIYTNTLGYYNDINLIIAPVGWAWNTVLEEKNFPLHYLHGEDYHHPSLNGSYLLACVIYSTIFLDSPVGVTFYNTLPPTEAEYLQQAAADMVLNNLSLWNNKASAFSIDTFPIKAEVLVDGRSWGIAPQHSLVDPGAHNISFTQVAGYLSPPPQQVTITPSQILPVTGTYTYISGTLSIDTAPASGEVFVDGVSWGIAPQSREVEFGPYSVTFGDVAGYVTPAAQPVNVAVGQTTAVTGDYIPAIGTLAIDTFPVKGSILVDSVNWGTAPLSNDIAYGFYTVSFGAVPGYATPADQQVIIGVGSTTTVTGTYIPTTGTLSIDTAPFAAEVFVDGTSWGTAPVSQTITAGLYTISFAAVDDYVTPPAQQVGVYADQTTTVSETYLRATVMLYLDTDPVKGELFVDGVSWGIAPQNRVIETGIHTVSFGDVPDHIKPAADDIIVEEDDDNLNITYGYTPMTGTLLITTTPEFAEVFVDNVSWGASPQSREITPGEHTIGFGAVEGYITPDDQSVVIALDQTSAVEGVYELIALPLPIDKLTVKSSKLRTPPADSVTLSGRIDPAGLIKLSNPGNDHTDASICIVHDTGTTIFGHLETLDPDKVIISAKRDAIKYSNPAPKGAAGHITSFKLDLKKAAFTLKAQNIDLSGLHSPVKVQIQIGQYLGEGNAYDGEALGSGGELDVINGKKSMPPNLLMGVTDSLTVTKYQFKPGKKPNTDKLTVEGAITLQNASTSLVNQDVILQWGNFQITLDSFFPVGNRIPLKYKKPKEKTGPAAAALFDFAKCTYKITITKANIGNQPFPLNFTIKFDQFNQSVTIE